MIQRRQADIYSSAESSAQCLKERSSYENSVEKYNNNNDSIIVPAMMLNEKGDCGEWDSQLEDDTKSNVLLF